MWKKSKMVLKLTLSTNGRPEAEIFTPVQVSGVDEGLSLVSFVLLRERRFRTVDFGEATFRIGKQKLEADRGGKFLVCEEVKSLAVKIIS
jgi:hypothetical protein